MVTVIFSVLSRKKAHKTQKRLLYEESESTSNKARVSVGFLSRLFILIPACSSVYQVYLEAAALRGAVGGLCCACVRAQVGRSPV